MCCQVQFQSIAPALKKKGMRYSKKIEVRGFYFHPALVEPHVLSQPDAVR